MKAPKGFLFSGISAKIKKSGKKDLGLILGSEGLLECAGYFTSNKVKAAPVILDIEKLKKSQGRVKAVLVNSGNANCFTGKGGFNSAVSICDKLALRLGVEDRLVLMSSTGIIGKRLPSAKIIGRLDNLINSLSKDVHPFAESILTTDTVKKISFKEIKLSKGKAGILGVAKGSGMIYPDLKKATMLAFIFTDVNITRSLLNKASKEAMEKSFNSITVDGCTSTNDSVFFFSSKQSESALIDKQGRDFEVFSSALKELCLDLAKKVVKDGEGAGKFITVEVKGVKSRQLAKKAAFAAANSNLLKTAVYGENRNTGRVIQALGQAGVFVSSEAKINISGLKSKDVSILVDLKQGKYSHIVYTSDLTPEYIRINAEYS